MPVAAEEYLETQVLTATPERLHLMVVDGALRFARQACSALEARDFGAAHFALSRSQACVIELIAGLDADRNPDLVRQLRGLFLFTHQNLVKADSDHDIQKIQDALRILGMHRETWLTLIERLQRELGPQPPAVDHGDGPTKSWEG